MLSLLIAFSAATALPFSFPQQWRDQMQRHTEPIYNHTRKFVHSVLLSPLLSSSVDLASTKACLSFGRFGDLAS